MGIFKKSDWISQLAYMGAVVTFALATEEVRASPTLSPEANMTSAQIEQLFLDQTKTLEDAINDQNSHKVTEDMLDNLRSNADQLVKVFPDHKKQIRKIVSNEEAKMNSTEFHHSFLARLKARYKNWKNSPFDIYIFHFIEKGSDDPNSEYDTSIRADAEAVAAFTADILLLPTEVFLTIASAVFHDFNSGR